ncbi:MAG: TVP38/TMEM64 family protein [Pseudomonadota bacterium]|nr:TVP38/TMEM64 family protein [Pseudomonadota bacterium]
MPEPQADAKPGFSLKRLLPLLILIAGLVLFLALGLHNYISFNTLQEHRETLAGWVEEHAVLAGLGYLLVYAAVIAFSLPGGAVMTITGGFLFGLWLGTALSVVGATIGAVLVFLAARTGLGEPLRARAGPLLRKMEDGFRDNALSYLLVLRLIPIFPFWAVNLVPAFLGVDLRTYIIGTFFGIIPGSFVYTSVGSGLGVILDAGQKPDLGLIFRPEILLPLVGLAVLALIPVIYKKYRARQS